MNSRPSRNHSIDFLRGLSILAVLLLHYGFFSPFIPLLISQPLYIALSRNGYLGVSIFFVISGFLITGMTLDRYKNLASIRLGEFYLFRFSRILPGLLLVTAINCVGHFLNIPFFRVKSLSDTLGYLFTFRFNLVSAFQEVPLGWSVLWSIAVEEVFYLGFPFLGKILRRPLLLSLGLLSVFALGPLYRLETKWGLYSYLGCFDLIALGCLTAIVARSLRFDLRPVTSLALRVAGLSWAAYAYHRYGVHQHYVQAPTLIGLGAATYLAGSTCKQGHVPLFVRPVAMMGVASYELYLFHMLGFFLISGLLENIARHPTLGTAFDLVFLAVCAVFTASALLIHLYVLEPVKVWIRHLSSSSNETSIRSRSR